MQSKDTASRLKQIMSERNLRQVDILDLAKPYCQRFGVKLSKTDLSQYVNGKVKPGQEKLTILGLALNVSETWLMGYDHFIARKSMQTQYKIQIVHGFLYQTSEKNHQMYKYLQFKKLSLPLICP